MTAGIPVSEILAGVNFDERRQIDHQNLKVRNIGRLAPSSIHIMNTKASNPAVDSQTVRPYTVSSYQVQQSIDQCDSQSGYQSGYQNGAAQAGSYSAPSHYQQTQRRDSMDNRTELGNTNILSAPPAIPSDKRP